MSLRKRASFALLALSAIGLVACQKPAEKPESSSANAFETGTLRAVVIGSALPMVEKSGSTYDGLSFVVLEAIRDQMKWAPQAKADHGIGRGGGSVRDSTRSARVRQPSPAALAASSVVCESSRAAVHRQPDGANALEQRIERLNPEAWAALDPALPQDPDLLARAWGNGGGRAWGNGRGRGFANGGGSRGFGNAYRGGFANLVSCADFGPIGLVVIQATSLCNLDCSYCYLPDRQKRRQFDPDQLRCCSTGSTRAPIGGLNCRSSGMPENLTFPAGSTTKRPGASRTTRVTSSSRAWRSNSTCRQMPR